MQDDAKRLEPCPHCGGKAEIRKPVSDMAGIYIRCTQCGCKTQRYVHSSGAIATWNRRTPAPAQPESDVIEAMCDAFMSKIVVDGNGGLEFLEEAMSAALAAMPATPPADADAGLVDALEESRRWEAKLILDERPWVVDSGVHIPQDLWDEYISTVQTKREAALGQGGARS